MEKETKTIKLSDCEVEIITHITWGQQEQIRAAMLEGMRVSDVREQEKQSLEMNPAVLVKAKYKALELCVKKITLTNGKEISYSKEWMDSLFVDDGDALFAAVNEVTSNFKKK